MTWETPSIEVREFWSGVEKSAQRDEVDTSRTYAIGRTSKRAVDLLIATSALLLLSPLFVIVAIAVKLSDKGPLFYSHPRIGFAGTSFGCLKFRSMKINAAAELAELLRSDPLARSEWEATRKLKHDPRITFVGGILRKSSIDELPQLLNVLRGEMSIVGPRPITTEELPRYGEHISSYLSGRPGITGHWQTSGRNDVSYDDRVSLDVHYISNWSLGLDFLIIAKTIPALFSQRGTY